MGDKQDFLTCLRCHKSFNLPMSCRKKLKKEKWGKVVCVGRGWVRENMGKKENWKAILGSGWSFLVSSWKESETISSNE